MFDVLIIQNGKRELIGRCWLTAISSWGDDNPWLFAVAWFDRCLIDTLVDCWFSYGRFKTEKAGLLLCVTDAAEVDGKEEDGNEDEECDIDDEDGKVEDDAASVVVDDTAEMLILRRFLFGLAMSDGNKVGIVRRFKMILVKGKEKSRLKNWSLFCLTSHCHASISHACCASHCILKENQERFRNPWKVKMVVVMCKKKSEIKSVTAGCRINSKKIKCWKRWINSLYSRNTNKNFKF